MKKKISLLLLTCIVILTNLYCKKTLTEPIEPPQPGRRDYVWSIDTIKIFSNNIMEIWGSAPNDIWGVGPGGALNTTIWHYDGNKWTTDEISRGISPYCVYGFAKNDVWIAGQNGRIWHYDGNNWSENYQHTINGFIGIDLYDLYGTSNHDLYAVGTVWFDNETRRGIILHYDGKKWTQKYLADFNSYFARVRVSYDNKCFIHCAKQDVVNYSRDTTVFYEFDGKGLKEIYSDENSFIKQGHESIIGGYPYFSFANTIYKYYKNEFVEMFKANSKFSSPLIYGRNEKDIFLGTYDGITHYNGTDIQLLLSYEGCWANGGILFDKEVFFLTSITAEGFSLIYHGKLK